MPRNGVFIGCTQDPSVNPNAFRLEDGPNGIAGGARYGYLGADQADVVVVQNQNNPSNGTVFLDPNNPDSNPGQTIVLTNLNIQLMKIRAQ